MRRQNVILRLHAAARAGSLAKVMTLARLPAARCRPRRGETSLRTRDKADVAGVSVRGGRQGVERRSANASQSGETEILLNGASVSLGRLVGGSIDDGPRMSNRGPIRRLLARRPRPKCTNPCI